MSFRSRFWSNLSTKNCLGKFFIDTLTSWTWCIRPVRFDCIWKEQVSVMIFVHQWWIEYYLYPSDYRQLQRKYGSWKSAREVSFFSEKLVPHLNFKVYIPLHILSSYFGANYSVLDSSVFWNAMTCVSRPGRLGREMPLLLSFFSQKPAKYEVIMLCERFFTFASLCYWKIVFYLNLVVKKRGCKFSDCILLSSCCRVFFRLISDSCEKSKF